MKKFYLLSCFIIVSLATYAQCVIDTSIQAEGFHPDTGTYLKSACAGGQYSESIQIYVPQSVTIQLGTFPVNYVTLDSIPDMPGALQYSTNPDSGKLSGGQRGCINIFGAVTAPAGDYRFTIYYTANFTAFGQPVSLSFMAPYKLIIDTGAPNYISYSDTACAFPGYSFGGQTLTASGTYIDTLSRTSNCGDSIITLHLTIKPFDVTVFVSGTLLTAIPGYESYQWINCGNNSNIQNATSNTYTAPVTGTYSVNMTNNGCTATSSCVTIVVSGIDDSEAGKILSIFPNPNKGVFEIGLNTDTKGSVGISLFDFAGRLVYSKTTATDSSIIINAPEIPAGYYQLQVVGDAFVYNRKVLVER